MSVSITTTYAGEFAGKYIAAALLSAPTLEQGGITIHPNVKYKQVIQKVGTNDIVKNATWPRPGLNPTVVRELWLFIKPNKNMEGIFNHGRQPRKYPQPTRNP